MTTIDSTEVAFYDDHIHFGIDRPVTDAYYDSENCILYVAMQNGSLFRSNDVPRIEWLQAAVAANQYTYFVDNIDDRHPSHEVNVSLAKREGSDMSNNAIRAVKEFLYTDEVEFASSSALHGAYYNRHSRELHVVFHAGRTAGYAGVDPEVWDILVNADSPGAYFNAYIKQYHRGIDSNVHFKKASDVNVDEKDAAKTLQEAGKKRRYEVSLVMTVAKVVTVEADTIEDAVAAAYELDATGGEVIMTECTKVKKL